MQETKNVLEKVQADAKAKHDELQGTPSTDIPQHLLR
jgi:hypothetical protein